MSEHDHCSGVALGVTALIGLAVVSALRPRRAPRLTKSRARCAVPERAVVRGHRAAGEADGSKEQPAALVEHRLLDDLVRTAEYRRRDREAERSGGLEVDDQLEFGRLLHR